MSRKTVKKNNQQDVSDLSSSNSDSYDDSDYRRKRRKKKSHRKTDPIKLYARLKAKLLAIAYKSNIIRSKLDEDPLQRRIYFPHICIIIGDDISQYQETCEVLLYYPKIGGENIKPFRKKVY